MKIINNINLLPVFLLWLAVVYAVEADDSANEAPSASPSSSLPSSLLLSPHDTGKTVSSPGGGVEGDRSVEAEQEQSIDAEKERDDSSEEEEEDDEEAGCESGDGRWSMAMKTCVYGLVASSMAMSLQPVGAIPLRGMPPVPASAPAPMPSMGPGPAPAPVTTKAGCYTNWSRCTPQTSAGTNIFWKNCPDYCRLCRGRDGGACKKITGNKPCSGGYQCQCVKKKWDPSWFEQLLKAQAWASCKLGL